MEKQGNITHDIHTAESLFHGDADLGLVGNEAEGRRGQLFAAFARQRVRLDAKGLPLGFLCFWVKELVYQR